MGSLKSPCFLYGTHVHTENGLHMTNVNSFYPTSYEETLSLEPTARDKNLPSPRLLIS